MIKDKASSFRKENSCTCLKFDKVTNNSCLYLIDYFKNYRDVLLLIQITFHMYTQCGCFLTTCFSLLLCLNHEIFYFVYIVIVIIM